MLQFKKSSQDCKDNFAKISLHFMQMMQLKKIKKNQLKQYINNENSELLIKYL